MERDQASKFVHDLLRLMVSRNGSDLFLTADFPPAIKVDGKITKVSPQPLTGQHTMALARSVMNDKQAAEFERAGQRRQTGGTEGMRVGLERMRRAPERIGIRPGMRAARRTRRRCCCNG